MSGKFALIIGNTEYTDPGLAQLTAPGKDAEDFARVLKDQDIGAFDSVNILLNQSSATVNEMIDEFFDQKKPDDLLVLYFSGHGVRDELGALYLAVKNTIRSRLRSTAVKSDYIREAMDQCRSKRQVLILDCCNSGAFAQGTKAATGVSIGTASAFEGGYGRIILTASDSTQFAWEGDKVIGETDNSLFTHYLVEGLEGEADQDGDGRITVDELYDYAYEKVRFATPKQTPSKFSSKQQGEIVLRQSMRIEDIKPVALPHELLDEIEDTRPYVREAAVQKLERLLKGKNIGLARSAREALEKVATDENTTRRVEQLATQVLESIRQAEKVEEERKATKETERVLAEQKADEERLAAEKVERQAKAQAKLKAKQEAEAQKAAEERITLEKVEAERKAKEKAQRLAAQKAEDERAAKEKADAERKSKQPIESLEHVKPRAQQDVAKKTGAHVDKSTKPRWVILWGISGIIIALILCGYVAMQFFPGLLGAAATQAPISTPGETIAPENNTGPHSQEPTTYTYVKSYIAIDTLDPALSYSTNEGEIIQNVYETLIFYDGEKTNEYAPMLAESWSVSSDGTVYSFNIRSGVKFHGGGDLTASDIAYSFQRGILQGSYSSPQFLLIEPLMGRGIDNISLLVDPSGNLYDDRSALQAYDSDILLAACERVKSAIVADDSEGTVTFYLAQPWGAFLSTISQPWGSIMDKEWVISNGGWDGSCKTWQNYYAMSYEEDPFSANVNGTGPFMLEKLTNGEEVILTRNNSYWREPAKLEKIIITAIEDWNARYSLLQSGDVDTIDVSSDNRSDMNNLVGEICKFDMSNYSYSACEVTIPGNPLRLHSGQPNPFISNVILYNFGINTDGGNPYLGSGALDGNGIPSDFFADLHIRKAFAYCFDWDSYIDSVFDNYAMQAFQLVPYGMLGYEDNAPHYTFDTAQCEAEFKQADVDHDGIPAESDPDDVWQTGFRFQFAYNEGNSSREPVGEVFAQNLRSVNDKFLVEVLGLQYSTYLDDLRNKRLPIMTGGWIEDIHDPHDRYASYISGTYQARQGLPEDFVTQGASLLDDGLEEIDPAKRAEIYYQLSQMYYDQAIGVPLAWPTNPIFEQRWVQGRIYNPVFQGIYFYTIYKE